MEREHFDFTPSRNSSYADNPADDEFEATRTRNQGLLNHVDQLMHRTATTHHEQMLQQLQQQGAQ